MNASSRLDNATSGPSSSAHPRFNRLAIATILAVGLLAWPAEAKIIYTPANVMISGNGSITLPQNGRTGEFTIQEVAGSGNCGVVGVEYAATVTVTPTTGNGVVSINGDASTLSVGSLIGPGQNFYGAQALMADERKSSGPPPCTPYSYAGYWCNEDQGRARPCYPVDAYLGLEVEFEDNTYYGWAHLVITPDNTHGLKFSVQLKGYAYETIPGQPINAGQTSDGD
jgi:hypothetical protein